MKHAALAGGKRLRPFLVIETSGLFGVTHELSRGPAAALELIHCYSLVHDDLPAMDNDDLRRGKPTVHKAWDEWTAILAGDALLTLAFETLADEATHPDAGVRAALTVLMARAAGAAGMVGGQALDLAFDKLSDPPSPDLAHVSRLQRMKTGALLRVACEAGAVLGTAEVEQRVALAAFGEALGAAFQIADDLLDVEGDAAVVGKATGKDARKATMVAALGTEAAKARLTALRDDAIAALAPFGAAADVLRETARFVADRTS
ncbi:MAG: polyprenyl synthetase family protein [Hyphomicrobiaceae bacterium]|nr:polyprenyl synthetase family protein [Hyphomicrobiaceae bacterium]